jgi:hypothetical protein
MIAETSRHDKTAAIAATGEHDLLAAVATPS